MQAVQQKSKDYLYELFTHRVTPVCVVAGLLGKWLGLCSSGEDPLMGSDLPLAHCLESSVFQQNRAL